MREQADMEVHAYGRGLSCRLLHENGYLAVTIRLGKHGRLHAFFTYQQMNLFLHKLLPLFLFLLTIHTAHAYDFEVDGIYYNTLTDSTVEVTYGSETWNQPTDSYTDSIVIPPSVTYDNVTYKVTEIGSEAFYNCEGMTSITLPNSLTYCELHAFDGCYGLTAVYISDLEAYCKVYYSELGGSASSPLYYADNLYLNGNLITELEFPEGITYISNAFHGYNKLTSVRIPESAKSIGRLAFKGCGELRTINLHNGITSIGERAFRGCVSLTSINIPDSVTSIEESTFSACTGLTSVVIPNGIKSIGNSAFSECTGLSSITFPPDITYVYTPSYEPAIKEYAFGGCNSVKSITCLGEIPPYCDKTALNGISRTECTLYVSKSSVSQYERESPWSEFENIVYGSSDSGGTPQTCSAPIITFDNSTKYLNFSCETEGAKIRHTITCKDMQESESTSTEVHLSGIYTISAYATAEGMYKSATTTAQLFWLSNATEESTGVLNAGTQRGIVISTNNGKIYVSGTTRGETVAIYRTNGTLLQNVVAENGNTVISGLPTNTVYVVKIGGTSTKVTL